MENVTPISHNGSRSAFGLLIKAVIAATVNFLLAKHLARLRKQPRRVAAYGIITAIVIPTFPIAELLISSIRALRSRQQHPALGQDPRFHLGLALDQRSLPDKPILNNAESTGAQENALDGNESSIPLFVLPPSAFTRATEQSNRQRNIHVGLLLFLLMPLSLAALLYLNRLATPSRSTYLDTYILMTIFSGLVLTTMCIGIRALDTTYTTASHYVQKFQHLNLEPDIWDLFIGILSTNMVDLRLSLGLGALVQSLAFMLLGGRLGETVTDDGGGKVSAGCDTPISMLRAELARAIMLPAARVAGPSGDHLSPRPCHSWNKASEMGLHPLVELSADAGYLLAIGCTLDVMMMLMYWAIRLLRHKDSSGAATVGTSRKKAAAEVAQRMKKRPWLIFTYAWQQPGCTYILMSYALISLAVYELTSPRQWEPWMEMNALERKLWFL